MTPREKLCRNNCSSEPRTSTAQSMMKILREMRGYPGLRRRKGNKGLCMLSLAARRNFGNVTKRPSQFYLQVV
eukprot:1157161-Pelagomonas_calceolata.AAC.18